MKMGKELNPHIGQIAIKREITATRPTTAPTGMSLGLYYSIEVMP